MKKILPHLLIMIISVILTVIFTWPFASKLNSFYYDRGDYQLSGATLSYNAYSIKNGTILNSDEYFNGFQFYPQPYTLLYSDLRLFPSLIFLLVNSLTGNFILSVNLVSFLTFVLSFLSSFYVIRFFTKSFLASIIGAIIFAFNPLTFSRFPEHFELLNKYFLPLLFLFAYKFFKSPNIKNGFLFALIFTANAFSAVYFEIFSILLLPFFALPFLWTNFIRKNKHYFFKLIFSSLIFLVFLPLLLYFNSAYLDFSKYEGSTRPINANAYFSARIIDFFSANKQSLLYGKFANSLDPFRAPKDDQGNFNYLEHTLFLNVIPVLLFIIFLIYYRRDKSKLLYMLSFTLILIVSLILSFGPYWQGWNSSSSDIKLPFYYFYQYLSFVQGIRAPTRILFFFYVPFALFASLGFLYLAQRIKRKNIVISIFILTIIGLFFENFYVQAPIVSYDEKSEIIPKIINFNTQNNISYLQDKKTIHYPIYLNEIGKSVLYLNWAALTHEIIANGNSGYISPEQYQFLQDMQDNFNDDTLKKLKALNFDYLIYHRDLLKNNTDDEVLNKLKTATIYDQNDIIIIDIKKILLDLRICSSASDLDMQYAEVTLKNNLQRISALIVKNSKDCYLPVIYKGKYIEKDINLGNLFGGVAKHKLYLKLPVIINPAQEVILSELNNNLRIE